MTGVQTCALPIFLFPDSDQTTLFDAINDAVSFSNKHGVMVRSNVLSSCVLQLRKHIEKKPEKKPEKISLEDAENVINESIEFLVESKKNKTTRHLNTQHLIFRLRRVFFLLPYLKDTNNINIKKYNIVAALFKSAENVNKDEICYVLSEPLRNLILDLYKQYCAQQPILPIPQELHLLAFLFNQYVLDYQESNKDLGSCALINDKFIAFKELNGSTLSKHHQARFQLILNAQRAQPNKEKIPLRSSETVGLPIVPDETGESMEDEEAGTIEKKFSLLKEENSESSLQYSLQQTFMPPSTTVVVSQDKEEPGFSRRWFYA